MQTLVPVSRVLMWVVLALSLFFQVGTIITIQNFDASIGVTSSYETGFMLVCTILLPITVIVFEVLRRGKLVPFIAAAVLGVCFVCIAHSLQAYYGAPAGTEAAGEYLTVWEALYKHALPALIPVLMIPLYIDYRIERRAAILAAEREEVPSILGNVGDFKLSSLADEEPPATQRKRKQ